MAAAHWREHRVTRLQKNRASGIELHAAAGILFAPVMPHDGRERPLALRLKQVAFEREVAAPERDAMLEERGAGAWLFVLRSGRRVGHCRRERDTGEHGGRDCCQNGPLESRHLGKYGSATNPPLEPPPNAMR